TGLCRVVTVPVQRPACLLAVDHLWVPHPQNLATLATNLFGLVADYRDPVVVVPEVLGLGLECRLDFTVDFRVAQEAANVPGEQPQARAIDQFSNGWTPHGEDPCFDVCAAVKSLQ